MINKFTPISRTLNFKGVIVLTGIFILPLTSQAQDNQTIPFTIDLSTSAYIVIGLIIALFTIVIALLKRRSNAISRSLKDMISELGTTRKRLVDTSTQLEISEKELKTTSKRYQTILFDANVGMFQLDADGTCSYINTTLQKITGLYPKKALKDGLSSAIHPDDRQSFQTAWNEFVESNKPFNQLFRFCPSKGNEVHVICRANKILNKKREVESYVGWVADVTQLNEENLAEKAITARYENFIYETIESYYQLVPESPIELDSNSGKMAETLISSLTLSDCNETFASLYGSKPAKLEGKSINDLPGGCGPFNTIESLQKFIDSGFKFIDLASIRKDPSGSRLNLMNNVIGIVEDNKLVAILGTQRNITRQKREEIELSSQITFMQRILNALPADLHVKDTRCRYVYASKRLAERTGIPQEEWIGKTIFEVMPETPRNHDLAAINTMKTSKGRRTERPYEVCGKSGWMESIQIPLVSDEGLVEGVVDLSMDISNRKKREEEAKHLHTELEKTLKHTQSKLDQSQAECSKAAISLSDTIQKLTIAETEKSNRENKFKELLDERKRSEEALRRSEQDLISRQQEIEKQLSERLQELEAETNKREKWEKLLTIKEEELKKIEDHASQLNQYVEQETTRRKQAESNLDSNQAAIEKFKKQIDELRADRENAIERLTAGHESKFTLEHNARTLTEKKLAKTEESLKEAQEKIKQMTEQHDFELEKEVAERKASAEKLIISMDELEELRQQFNQRIDEETRSMKQELSKKQIQEKSLRQNEKDLESRIKELEKTLQLKTKEFAEQIQAREGAEVQKKQMEQQLEQLNRRQEGLIDRETQKLNLSIAEIRLDEIKLRKHAGDLEREKEQLEEALQTRNQELEQASHEIKQIKITLAETQAQLQQMTGDQSKIINKETAYLQKQLEELRQIDERLQKQLVELKKDKEAVEQSLETRNNDLTDAAREYRKVADAYKESQSKLKAMTDEQEALITEKNKEVNEELKKLKASEKMLLIKEKDLEDRIEKQQKEFNQLTENLRTERTQRENSQQELKNLQAAFENADEFVLQQSQELAQKIEEFKKKETEIIERDQKLEILKKEREETSALLKSTESRLENIEKEHQIELKRSMAGIKEIRQMNHVLVDELNTAVQESLSPVVKTTLIMREAENLSKEQKHDLSRANHTCRTLIDTMNYRTELTHLADSQDELTTEQCDLHKLMANIDQQFCQRAETKKLFFAVSVAQYQDENNLTNLIETDQIKLHKVLCILLGYAIEKTEKGRIGLHATRKTSESSSSYITFELAYTSKDPSDSLLSKIFDSNEEPPIDLKFGLTLARRYISMLGGVLKLEYREAGITVLKVDFPFSRIEPENITASKDGSKQAGAA